MQSKPYPSLNHLSPDQSSPIKSLVQNMTPEYVLQKQETSKFKDDGSSKRNQERISSELVEDNSGADLSCNSLGAEGSDKSSINYIGGEGGHKKNESISSQ